MTNPEYKLKTGTYRVSFDISITREDKVDSSDIAHSIVSGFDDTALLPKVANLEIVPLTKQGFTVGEQVFLQEDLEILAEIKEQGGIPFVDAGHLLDIPARSLGMTRVTLRAGTKGVITKIAGDDIEITDIGADIFVPLQDAETDDIIEYRIEMHSALLPSSKLEKVTQENVDVE